MKTKVVELLKKDTIPFLVVVFSSIIYSLGFVWFLAPVGVYAGGLTGIAQLISGAFDLIGIELNVGILIFVFNIPILIVGFKSVSKRFAIYSIISVVLQSIFTSGVIPFVDFVVNTGDSMNLLVCSIVGAIITGFACGFSLRFGTSTGGIDVLAQAATIKDSKISIGTITMISNIMIGCIGGGLVQGKLDIILYTFIRIILTSITVDKIHTAYSFVSLNIISSKSEEIANCIITKMNRSCTILHAEGAYTKNSKFDIFLVVSSYEIHTSMDLIKQIDPNVFVVVSPVKRIFGNFAKKTII